MDKKKKILRILGFASLFLVIVGYLAYYMFVLSEPDPNEVCTAVELVMEDAVDAQFISQSDVESMLTRANLYPQGKTMKAIDADAIEKAVSANPFVEEVNCYKSPTGKVIVNVKQRTPVVYVIPDGKKGFFLDEAGVKIPNVRYVKNIVVATGDIDDKYAAGDLLDFACFLQGDDFWNAQIEQVYVRRDRKQKRVVELVPRVGDHVIYLGDMSGYRDKLERLRLFYEKAIGTVGWNKYSKINLEYGNQIICTKQRK